MNGFAERPSVLLIDDDVDFCELLKMWLAERYDVEIAHDGERGIEIAAQNAPDIILLDIMMPKLSGFSLAWVFKHDRRYRASSVIFITALDVNQRSRSQTDGYLKKPFSRSEILTVIERTLGARSGKLAQVVDSPIDEMSDGKRRAPRVNVEIPASLQIGERRLEGTIRSLSPWGAFFATDELVPSEGGRVRFTAAASEFELPSFPLYRGQHEGAEGVGLRLSPPKLDVESQLYEFIEQHLPPRASC